MTDIFDALKANTTIFTRDKVTTSVAMDKFKDYTIPHNSKIIKFSHYIQSILESFMPSIQDKKIKYDNPIKILADTPYETDEDDRKLYMRVFKESMASINKYYCMIICANIEHRQIHVYIYVVIDAIRPFYVIKWIGDQWKVIALADAANDFRTGESYDASRTFIQSIMDMPYSVPIAYVQDQEDLFDTPPINLNMPASPIRHIASQSKSKSASLGSKYQEYVSHSKCYKKFQDILKDVHTVDKVTLRKEIHEIQEFLAPVYNLEKEIEVLKIRVLKNISRLDKDRLKELTLTLQHVMKDTNIHTKLYQLQNKLILLQKALLKPMINKLQRTCIRAVDKEACSITTAASVKLALRTPKNYNMRASKITIDVSDVSDVSDVKYIDALYDIYVTNPRLFSLPIDKIFVKLDEVSVDAGGPRRQFFSTIADEVFSSEYLLQLEDEGMYYGFNHSISNKTKEEIRSYYVFLGSLTAWMILNGFQYKSHFSMAILANLLYKKEELTDNNYSFFFIMDNPKFATNMLFTIEHDPYALTNLGDGYKLTFEDFDTKVLRDPFTKTKKTSPSGVSQIGWNKKSVSGLLGSPVYGRTKHKVNASNYHKYLAQRGLSQLVISSMNAFKSGFYSIITSKMLWKNKVTLGQLDMIITGSKVTKAVRMEISRHISTYSQIDARVRTYFCNILENKRDIPKHIWENTVFPYQDRFEQMYDSSKIPSKYDAFISGLLLFWTGSSSFHSDKKYVIRPRISGLPVAHTCGFLIEMPTDVSSEDELLYRLCIAISTASSGFQIA